MCKRCLLRGHHRSLHAHRHAHLIRMVTNRQQRTDHRLSKGFFYAHSTPTDELHIMRANLCRATFSMPQGSVIHTLGTTTLLATSQHATTHTFSIWSGRSFNFTVSITGRPDHCRVKTDPSHTWPPKSSLLWRLPKTITIYGLKQ